MKLMHTGITETGAVIATPRDGTGLVLSNPSPERALRVTEQLGDPFVRFPGNLPEHKIVGEIQWNGEDFKVSVMAVEMVWNDARMLDSAERDGFYAKLFADRPESQVLALAQRLYADGAA